MLYYFLWYLNYHYIFKFLVIFKKINFPLISKLRLLKFKFRICLRVDEARLPCKYYRLLTFLKTLNLLLNSYRKKPPQKPEMAL